MKKKFISLSFVMFFSHALLFTQMVPFLTDIGYTATQRGYVVAAYATFAMIGQVIFGYLADRFGTIKKFLIFLTIIIAFSGYLTYAFSGLNFIFHFLMMSTTAGSTRVTANLYETWVLEHEETHDEFSFIRSFGSLGWAIASLFSGFMAVRYGYQSLGIGAGVLSIFVLFLAARSDDATKISTETLRIQDLKVLFKNKNYILLIFIFFFAYLIYNTDTVIITDYIYLLGGDAQDVGIKWFIQALSELPILFLGSFLMSRISVKKLMTASLFFLMLRFIFTGFATSVWQIIILSLFQLFTFPIFLITQRYLIYREVPVELRSSGQMVGVSLSIGLSSIIAPLLSSFLSQFLSIQHTIILLGLVLIIPIIIVTQYR